MNTSRWLDSIFYKKMEIETNENEKIFYWLWLLISLLQMKPLRKYLQSTGKENEIKNLENI